MSEHKNLLVEVAQLWSFVTAATDPKTVSERILLYLSPLCFLFFVFALFFLLEKTNIYIYMYTHS